MLVSVILAPAFSSVIALIADLDRSSSGSIIVNQQPLFEFQQKLKHYAE
jgi:predicted ABC-type transport system involved in lysophospholipase L1 biosynthesis ATPase subunit